MNFMNDPLDGHLSNDQLVLYYYSEGAETAPGAHIDEHLGACEHCRASYQTLQRVLNSVDSFPVPERDANYEERVWASVEKHARKRRPFWTSFLTWRPAIAMAAMAVLIVAAFLAGRSFTSSGGLGSKKPGATSTASVTEASQVRERVLLVAVGDHLERSQMMLIELANATPASGHLDISYEQQTAEDLLDSNRLYRQTAATNGDARTAALLDDLESVLLEIAHSPSAVSTAQWEDLRSEIQDRELLFKVKVYGSQVEQREAVPPAGTVSF